MAKGYQPKDEPKEKVCKLCGKKGGQTCLLFFRCHDWYLNKDWDKKRNNGRTRKLSRQIT